MGPRRRGTPPGAKRERTRAARGVAVRAERPEVLTARTTAAARQGRTVEGPVGRLERCRSAGSEEHSVAPPAPNPRAGAHSPGSTSCRAGWRARSSCSSCVRRRRTRPTLRRQDCCDRSRRRRREDALVAVRASRPRQTESSRRARFRPRRSRRTGPRAACHPAFGTVPFRAATPRCSRTPRTRSSARGAPRRPP